MAACLMQVHYRTQPLASIGEAARIKNGANIAFHIPLRKEVLDPDVTDENLTRQMESIMGEATDHLTKLRQRCEVNEDFGTYEDCLGLVANIWLQQRHFYKAEPKAEITKFAETVGDAICNPRIKRWLKQTGPKKPEIAFMLLNGCEQAFILASGQTRKRSETAKITVKNWDGVNADPYEEIAKIAAALATKLDSASRGGESFTPCALFENSKKAKALKRAADELRGQELLSLKRALQSNTTRGGGGGGGGGTEDGGGKKTRRELATERKTAHDGKTAVATEADRRGDIIAEGFLKCPTIKGARQPCGANYRQGVACSKWVATGKCARDHTPIDDLSEENKAIWVEHVNKNPGMDFNDKSVKSLKKEGDAWVVK